jgi:hypothetical protein
VFQHSLGPLLGMSILCVPARIVKDKMLASTHTSVGYFGQ